MFGSADDEQLEDIANLSTGKVFDGRTNLLEAFKVVRGYN
jgi:Ca-activated chloride channel family protein